MIFRVLLLLTSITGEHSIVEGPSLKPYENEMLCKAAIPDEVAKAMTILEKIKVPVKVEAARCFSEDALNKLRGGASASEPSPDGNSGEEKVD